MIPRANYQKQMDVNLWVLGDINKEDLKERIRQAQHGGYSAYNDGTFISPSGLEQLTTKQPKQNIQTIEIEAEK